MKKILVLVIIVSIVLVLFNIFSDKEDSKYDGTYVSNAYNSNYELKIKGENATFTAIYSSGNRVDKGTIKFDGDKVVLHIDGEDVPGIYDESKKTIVLRDEMIFVKK